MPEHILEENATSIHMVRLCSGELALDFISRAEQRAAWKPAASAYREVSAADFDDQNFSAAIVSEIDEPDLFTDVRAAILRALARFADPASGGRAVLSKMSLSRYASGGMLKTHSDRNATINRYRRISGVCYLNSDYEGGETYFPRIGQGYRGAPGQGLLFPSHYAHRSDVVSAGTKYVVVFFLCDPETVPDGDF